MKKKRVDNKMRGVVLNTEDRDKKFALKYLVKDLPHPYSSVEQYKKTMDVAIGKEWTTLQSHKRLIQPEVLTKVGEIIKPLRYAKDVAPQTLDALV
jgi:U3 small nucleolar RNA-associated protein 14